MPKNRTRRALLDFLKAMGCEVREQASHASVRIDVDSPHLNTLSTLIWKTSKEERWEWISESRATGDIFFE